MRGGRVGAGAGDQLAGLVQSCLALPPGPLLVLLRPEGDVLDVDVDLALPPVRVLDGDRLVALPALDLVGGVPALVAGACVVGLREHPVPGLGVRLRAPYGLRVDEAVAAGDERGDVGGAVVALVPDGDDPLALVVALHALEDGEHRAGVGRVAGEEPVADRYAARVLQQAHLHDGALAVLLGHALLPEPARLVDLEVVVGDVVEHAGGVADAHPVDGAVDGRDDPVAAGAQHIEGAVGVVEGELRPEEVAVPVLPRVPLGAGVQDALDGEQPHHGVGVVVGLGAPGGVADGPLDPQLVVDGEQRRRAVVLAVALAGPHLLHGVDLDAHGLRGGLGLGVGGVAHGPEVGDRVVVELLELVEVAQRLHRPHPLLPALAVRGHQRQVGPSVLALRLVEVHG